MRDIQQKTMDLAKKAVEFLINLRHRNDRLVGKIYGKGWSKNEQGPIVTFNLLRDNSTFVGFVEVFLFFD